MPLDSESKAILAARRRVGIPPISGLTAREVRASRKVWSAGSVVPTVTVNQITDLVLPADFGRRPVRVYRPGPGEGLPVVVYLHGGGWVIGDLDHSDPLCRHLCRETGCVIVNVDYRLAPEHKYPCAAEDTFSAIQWVAARAADIGADPSRIAVAGASAGGNLAAVAALMCRNRNGPALAAQLLVYPVTDAACAFPSYAEFAEGYIVSTEDMRWYWQQYLVRREQAAEPFASPFRARDLAGLPPALVITAECDAVRDDGERYAERLQSFGVAARISRYPGVLHGFFAQPGLSAKATLAVAEAAGFLREALAGDGPP